MFNDPSGEFIVAALIGAAIGVITNGINNLNNGEAFFEGAGKAALIGGIQGAFSFGVGNVASSIAQTSAVAAGIFQVASHSFAGGVSSALQGGNFGTGALSGAIGSVMGSGGTKYLANSSGFVKAFGTTLIGGLSGGIGSSIAGGKFWDGFRNGAIAAGLNHAAHSLLQTDPLKKYKDKAISLKEWVKRYGNKSWEEIATEAGWKQGQPLGPKDRYVINPIDGNVMDMRHVAVVGYGYGESAGNLIEHIQNLHPTTRPSAYDPQDYYSNRVGAQYYQLRHSGSWASDSWSYDFGRFIDVHYRNLFSGYKP